MVAVGDAVDDGVDWRPLVRRIRRRQVAIVLGPSCYASTAGGPDVEADLARRTEQALALPPSTTGLREVGLAYLRQPGSTTAALRKAIRRGVDELTGTPEILAQLAEVGVDLYITLGYDALLEAALTTAGRSPVTASYLAEPNDLPDAPTGPVVYHLLGTTDDAFAVTDADMVEHIHRLRGDSRPAHLFDELQRRDLIFLGCGFPDWLARFFHRAINDAPFTRNDQARTQIVVDPAVAADARLVQFLSYFQFQVIASLTPAQFAARLVREWRETPQLPIALAAVPIPMPSEDGKSIFVSYCHDDIALVRPIVTALRAIDLPVFFDEQSLAPAVAWEAVLEESLARCVMFLPIITPTTQAQTERYFFSEWRAAAKRATRLSFAPGPKFLLPVVVGGVNIGSAYLPAEFKEAQALMLPDGGPTDDFVTKVKDTYRVLRAKAPK